MCVPTFRHADTYADPDSGMLCLCVVRCVFAGTGCLLRCGASDDRCIGFSFVRWQFGGSIVDLLVVFDVPLLSSFVAMPGLCCFVHVRLSNAHRLYLHQEWFRLHLPCISGTGGHTSQRPS